MTYDDLILKIPVESASYYDDSTFVIQQIRSVLAERKAANDAKVVLNTILKRGLPLENINKIAGPLIEAWAFEVFSGIRGITNNKYNLIKR